MTAKQTVLLLGNYRPTLTLARVLSRRGYRIISGLEGCDGGAEHSRYVDEIWDHPPLETNPEGFLKQLGRFIQKNHVDIVFPVSEEFVRFFAERPNADIGSAVIAMAEPSLIERCLDKVFMMELAQKHNVPTAPFAFVQDQSRLVSECRELGFPLVVRPQATNLRLDGRKALFISDERDLEGQFPRWPAQHKGLIIQKKACGLRHNIYFAATAGKMFRYLHAVILRTDAKDGSGLAVEGITVKPDEGLRRFTAKLVEKLDYSGLGCAQYLVDEETGQISFLEINPRIAGNHAVPEMAGLNLSSILIDMAKGEALDTCYRQGKPGLRYVWTYGDLASAKNAWLRREAGHFATVARILRTLWVGMRAHIHMAYVWHDPKPGIISLMSLAPDWRRLAARLAKGKRGAIRAQTEPPIPTNTRKVFHD